MASAAMVVFGLVDFTLLHVEEADETFFAVAGGFEDDWRGGAHGAAEDAVTDFEWLAIALADEERVERVGVDADAGELMRVVSAEEGFEFGFVGWAAPFVLRLIGEIEIGQALDVRGINAGDRR